MPVRRVVSRENSSRVGAVNDVRNRVLSGEGCDKMDGLDFATGEDGVEGKGSSRSSWRYSERALVACAIVFILSEEVGTLPTTILLSPTLNRWWLF